MGTIHGRNGAPCAGPDVRPSPYAPIRKTRGYRKEAVLNRMSITSGEADVGATLPVRIVGEPAPLVGPARLSSRRFVALRRQLALADVLAAMAAALVSAGVAGLDPRETGLLAVIMGLGWPALAFACGLYASEDLRAWSTGVGEASKLVLACLLLSWPVYGIASGMHASHAVVGALTASVATAAAAGTFRAAARARLHRAPELRQRTLIVGSGVVARQLAARLHNQHDAGLDPIGFIDDHAHEPEMLGLPHLGGLDALHELVATRRVERVIIAFSRAGHDELLHCVRVCRDGGIAIDIVPRLFEFLEGARTLDQIGGMPLLSINAPTFSPLSRASKRALDVALSSVALLALAPLLAVIVIAIRLESRGPILFRQPRVGRHGRTFSILKFRSMFDGADDRKLELRPVNDLTDGVMFKIYRDQRVTRVGRMLRRFSLDELPQLFNVLRGEMSLVGPRPLVPEEAAAMTSEWQMRRVDLRPGLTGSWQIAGRSHIPFHEMVRFDYQYVAGWSLARDIEILLATLPVVLSGRGAY